MNKKTEAQCDICESPMIMSGKKGVRVHFGCTSCEQSWGIDSNGAGCTILKTLWPSGMKEDSKMYRESFLSEWLKQKKQRTIMFFVAGFLSEEKKDEELLKAQETHDNWFIDHPLKKPWYQRLFIKE